MFNLNYRSHRILSDFMAVGSKSEVINWEAYGYSKLRDAQNTLRVSARLLELPVYVCQRNNELMLVRLDFRGVIET